jgi:hypothetical protein
MRVRTSTWLLWLTALGAAGCTQSNVYSNNIEPNVPNKITISGTLCTDDPAERQFPVRVMFLVDTSGSMGENDTEARRQSAVQGIINRYATSPNYTFAVIKFAGNAVQLTADPLTQSGYTKNMAVLNDAIYALASVDPCEDGCRDWIGALSLASSIFTGDVLITNPGALSRTRYVFIFLANGPPDPGLTAGDLNNDGVVAAIKAQLVAAVKDLADFGEDKGAAEVAFHAIQLDNIPGQCTGLPAGDPPRFCSSGKPCPADCSGGEACEDAGLRRCTDDVGVGCATDADCTAGLCRVTQVCLNDASRVCVRDETCCPRYVCNEPRQLENERTAELLQAMAFAGRGESVRFTTGPELNMEVVDLDTTQGVFVKKALVVANTNVRTLCGEVEPDSDADGLSDREEACYAEVLSRRCDDLRHCDCTSDPWDKATGLGTDTDPTKADTDGDGLGDLLEMLFATVDLDPLRVDVPQACLELERPYKDVDSDGLNDCEEQVLGTDRSLYDSDRDGYPDVLEFRAGSNYLRADNLHDTDMDGLKNGRELEEHLDPQCNDTKARSSGAYRYDLVDEGLKTLPFISQPRAVTGVKATDVSPRSPAGAGKLFFYPSGTSRPDGGLRDVPSLAWAFPADSQIGPEVPLTGSGDYVLFAACACVQDCPAGCAPGEWCNPNTGVCEPDACALKTCASTETCDSTEGRCVVDCQRADCPVGERCDPLLGRCLTDRCMTLDCSGGLECDPEAGVCTAPPCGSWACPAGRRVDPTQKPIWITVRVDASLLPQSGFFCDGSAAMEPCTGDATCPINSVCRLREALVVGVAQKNCISFKVKNVTLVETLETQPGFGAGFNNIFVYFAQTPLDNPYAFSIFRVALVQMRYYNGVKEPDWSEAPLSDADFFPIEEK